MENVDSIISQINKEEDVFNKAKLIYNLKNKNNLKIIDLAKKLNCTASYICHLLRLNTLSPFIIDGYYSKLICVSHLFIISRIKDKKLLMSVYEKILTKNFNIIQTEELVRDCLYGIKTRGKYINEKEKQIYLNEIINKNENVFVNIVQTRIKSKIIIEVKGGLDKTSEVLMRLIKKLSV